MRPKERVARRPARRRRGMKIDRTMRKITAEGRPREIADRGEGSSRAYIKDLAGAKTGASVKPVIIPQFVDLDTFATVGRLKLQRHDPGSKDR